ncbi:VTT domain-containing protein [Priestia megaterium]|uniref:TVP38/TMEM64 family protein n=1 Tax=Priestia megaterium TaxID=1404 RepID=UPI002FFE7581
MQSYLESLLSTYPQIAIISSVLISVVVSILGFIPSTFVTAINLKIFGLWEGTIISFLGEVIGAIISFVLYRKGFNRIVEQKVSKYPKVQRLLHVTGKEAILMVFSLRLMPFVPSSIVTFLSAVGKISPFHFFMASTLGKIPALAIEVYSTYQIVTWTKQGMCISIFLLVYGWRKWRSISK